MSHGNNKLARLARPHAECAILGLAAAVDGCQSASARVAAARALLEFGYGQPRAKPTAVPIPRVIKIDWADPTE